MIPACGAEPATKRGVVGQFQYVLRPRGGIEITLDEPGLAMHYEGFALADGQDGFGCRQSFKDVPTPWVVLARRLGQGMAGAEHLFGLIDMTEKLEPIRNPSFHGIIRQGSAAPADPAERAGQGSAQGHIPGDDKTDISAIGVGQAFRDFDQTVQPSGP